MAAARDDLDQHMRAVLDVDRFKDYGPNGLQVQGKDTICKIVTGVTASRALIDAAIEAGADAILVHHGLFWRGHDGRITGWLKERVARLLKHDINLWAFHLPLDAHPAWGNNAQWAQRMGWPVDGRFGDQELGFLGTLAEPISIERLTQRVEQVLGRTPLALPGDGRPLRRLAWCSGGAQGYFESAIAAGADVFLTGEVSEPQVHSARESGVAFLACGHHATERFGAAALGGQLSQAFSLDHAFIDIDNPA